MMKTKRIVLGLICCIGMLTASCDNDDNNGGNSTSPIAAKWNITKVGSRVAGQEVLIDPPQNEDGCAKDFIEFDTDGTLMAGDYDSSTTPCALTTKSGTYVRTGNQLVTVIDGTSRTQEILNLTNIELKVEDESGAIVLFTKN